MEADIVPPTGIAYHLVTSKKLRKILSPGTSGVLISLLRGYREASAFLKSFRPDVVISTGGYTAAATALAAAKQNRPTIIQEYNAIPGRTNLWLSRRATRICVWFEETIAAFPAGKSVITGVPLRQGIVNGVPAQGARAELGLDPDRFTVLVLGGSQGAMALTHLVLDAAVSLSESIQLMHQTGARNIEEVTTRADRLRLPTVNYKAIPFLENEEVPNAYAAADMLICRCGISTLAEACLSGVPMIMVPLPTAYADHQTANARVLEKHGAGIHTPEGSLTGPLLAEQITRLMNDQAQLRNMSDMASRLGRPNAALEVARLAIDLASGTH
jgi:UDP-N-acetylglucosamine--N-acetylmuramyl-(pentapeptide) pyrophosphoryl-undecaprenol N-acetylglucosamine transferase